MYFFDNNKSKGMFGIEKFVKFAKINTRNISKSLLWPSLYSGSIGDCGSPGGCSIPPEGPRKFFWYGFKVNH